MMSLSDNLKPWTTIEQRLDLACQADLVLAFYNPISRSRPWQLGRALEIVRKHREGQTPVVLGRDIGRPGQTLKVVSLDELLPDMVDMRTMVLVGSSTTCTFARAAGGSWVYTPRWYPTAP
jgi:cobalt-precorrin 5A hydrolase/precorrin-3B C17-methyltransferase